MDRSQRCDPGGAAPARWAIVGEAPGAEEIAEGRGFVGQSGELLWPLVAKFAGVDRSQCWVTNVCKYRLDDTLASDKKLTPAEFEAARDELLEELTWIAQPKRVLAVGTIAARALMGDAFTTMDACSGMTWTDPHPERGWTVVPCFHPGAALRGGGEGSLTKTVRAIEVWRETPVVTPRYNPRWLAIDTEGTPSRPLMLTWARRVDGEINSGVVYPRYVAEWWRRATEGATAVYHNVLWDWAVIEAMGVERPWDVPFEDTMERVYIRALGEPQGLKALAWRFLGIRMREYNDVVRPYWEEMVKAYAEGFVAAHTSTVYRPLKRGGFSKKGKIVIEDVAKPIKRVLGNPDTLAERLGFPEPDLSLVPKDEAEQYAIQDAVSTLLIRELL